LNAVAGGFLALACVWHITLNVSWLPRHTCPRVGGPPPVFVLLQPGAHGVYIIWPCDASCFLPSHFWRTFAGLAFTFFMDRPRPSWHISLMFPLQVSLLPHNWLNGFRNEMFFAEYSLQNQDSLETSFLKWVCIPNKEKTVQEHFRNVKCCVYDAVIFIFPLNERVNKKFWRF